MKDIETIKLIEDDIKYARDNAAKFLDLFFGTIGVAIVFLLLYTIPDFAAKHLPEAQNKLQAAKSTYEQSIQNWQKEYKRPFYRIDEDTYKKKSETGSLTNEEISAYKITPPVYQAQIVTWLQFAVLFQIDGGKLESLMKAIPIFLSALCAGFLLTYRHHSNTAHELVKEKYRLINTLNTSQAKSQSTKYDQ